MEEVGGVPVHAGEDKEDPLALIDGGGDVEDVTVPDRKARCHITKVLAS